MINREVYTYFDSLGDTGGLNSIAITISMMILAVFNTNKAENDLVERLYKSDADVNNRLRANRQFAIVEWFSNCLPHCLKSKCICNRK